MGHARPGGRDKNTSSNAISARAVKAIAAAAKRIPRGARLSDGQWQQVIDTNPLIIEALQKQDKFTLAGTPRFRMRKFNMKAFCKDLSTVAMRAIQTDQFDYRDLVQCLTLLAVRDHSEFAKLPLLDALALTRPRRRKIAPGPQTPPRRRFFVRCSDGCYAPIPRDQHIPDDAYEYDSTKNRFVRVG